MDRGNLVELNVGGHLYTTTLATMTKYPSSKLSRSVASYFDDSKEDNDIIPKRTDRKSRYFIDRDGETFRYILDYLRRSSTSGSNWIKNMIPSFDFFRLRTEAEYYGLTELVDEIDACRDGSAQKKQEDSEQANAANHMTSGQSNGLEESVKKGPLSSKGPYFVSIGCRGYYSAERDNPANDMTKFRKITRITVSGRSDVAKEVFSGELNESRDPERFPPYGYTCRYYLTHTYLENAFETLAKRGFELVTSFSTGNQTLPSTKKDEFKQWSTYVEYLFYKRSI